MKSKELKFVKEFKRSISLLSCFAMFGLSLHHKVGCFTSPEGGQPSGRAPLFPLAAYDEAIKALHYNAVNNNRHTDTFSNTERCK